MKKYNKKIWALFLVIATFVAFAALPANAEEEYHIVFACTPSKTDANGNTFTPGVTIDGVDARLNYARVNATVRTWDYTLSLQDVYALSVCDVFYDDAAHTSKRVGFYERVGIMDTYSLYFCNRNLVYLPNGDVDPKYRSKHVYNPKTKDFDVVETELRNYGLQETDWRSVGVALMLSNSTFVQPNKYDCRFPSALGSFNWSATYTYADIMES